MLSGLAYAAADSGVVRMELAGSAANPPLVVMQGLKTAVLFRGPEANADDVRRCWNNTTVRRWICWWICAWRVIRLHWHKTACAGCFECTEQHHKQYHSRTVP